MELVVSGSAWHWLSQETVPNFLVRLAHKKAHNFLQTKALLSVHRFGERLVHIFYEEKGFLKG